MNEFIAMVTNRRDVRFLDNVTALPDSIDDPSAAEVVMTVKTSNVIIHVETNALESSKTANTYNFSVTTWNNLSTPLHVENSREKTARVSHLSTAYLITRNAHKISQYIVAPLSLVTNSLSIAVFCRMRHTMQKEAIIVFVAIAVVDTFALTDQFDYIIYSNFRPASVIRSFPSACKLFKWIAGTAQMCSSFLVCLYTFERFISVRFPLKRAIICPGRRIRIAVLGIFFICPVLESYNFVTYWSNGLLCARWPEWKRMHNQLNLYIHFCIGTLIPYCCIGCLNATIVHHVIKYRKKRAALQANSVSSDYRTQKSITIMLCLASTYSLFIQAPWLIDVIIDPNEDFRSRTVEYFGRWARQVILPLNYCGNFFFYIVGGKTFRKELFSMLSCHKPKGKHRKLM